MAFQLESRVEVFVPGGQELLLKPSDMTVALLSRVFKVAKWSWHVLFAISFLLNSLCIVCR